MTAPTRHPMQIVREAEAALRPKRKRSSSTPPAKPADPSSPTPERIARSAGGYMVTKAGAMRITEAPIDRLHGRRLLHEDADINGLLFGAGDRYRTHWFNSGLSGLSGMAYGSVAGGSGHPAYSMPATEAAASFRAMWRLAFRSMSEDEAKAVGYVVLDETSLVDAGHMLTGKRYKSRKAEMVAMDLLRSGLRALARHYGMGGT